MICLKPIYTTLKILLDGQNTPYNLYVINNNYCYTRATHKFLSLSCVLYELSVDLHMQERSKVFIVTESKKTLNIFNKCRPCVCRNRAKQHRRLCLTLVRGFFTIFSRAETHRKVFMLNRDTYREYLVAVVIGE